MDLCIINAVFFCFQKFEQQYIEQAKRGVASEKAQFEYAWCLIRSKQEIDMKKGVALLEGRYKVG